MYTVNRSIYAHLIVEWINTEIASIFLYLILAKGLRERLTDIDFVSTLVSIFSPFSTFSLKKKKIFETITSKTWKLEITYLQVFKLEGIGIREVYFNSNRRSTSIAITTTIDCWYVDTIERYNLRLLRYLERFVRRNIGRDRCKSWD